MRFEDWWQLSATRKLVKDKLGILLPQDPALLEVVKRAWDDSHDDAWDEANELARRDSYEI